MHVHQKQETYNGCRIGTRVKANQAVRILLHVEIMYNYGSEAFSERRQMETVLASERTT